MTKRYLGVQNSSKIIVLIESTFILHIKFEMLNGFLSIDIFGYFLQMCKLNNPDNNKFPFNYREQRSHLVLKQLTVLTEISKAVFVLI